MKDLPATIVAATVWTYWGCVVALVIRSHLRFRTAAGAVPHTARERLMWRLWMPAVLAWQVLPLMGVYSSHPVLGMPSLIAEGSVFEGVVSGIRWAAAGVAVLAYLGTVPCWLRMGRNWSMAVVPAKRSKLITAGMFARVRHPIYAFSMLLMLATMIVVPSPAMLAVGLVHLWMLHSKATSEEKYLHQLHGESYAAYCAQTGRFVPRIFSGAQSPPPPQRRAA